MIVNRTPNKTSTPLCPEESCERIIHIARDDAQRKKAAAWRHYRRSMDPQEFSAEEMNQAVTKSGSRGMRQGLESSITQ
jgi:hypothetical protein